jgi:hypothetical protein
MVSAVTFLTIFHTSSLITILLAKTETGSGCVVGCQDALPDQSPASGIGIRVATLVDPRPRQICLLGCRRLIYLQLTSIVNRKDISSTTHLI